MQKWCRSEGPLVAPRGPVAGGPSCRSATPPFRSPGGHPAGRGVCSGSIRPEPERWVRQCSWNAFERRAAARSWAPGGRPPAPPWPPMAERPGGGAPASGALASVLRRVPCGLVVAEAPGGRLLQGAEHLEAVWRRRLPEGARVCTLDWGGLHPDGRAYAPEEWPLCRTLADGETVQDAEIEIVRGDGTRGAVRVSTTPVHDEEGRLVAGVMALIDVTEQRRRDLARRLLAEASASLASSLDYQTTLKNVARLMVPMLADWCGIDIVGEEGAIERLVVVHADPAKQGLAEEIKHRFPTDPAALMGVAKVIREGVSEIVPDIDDGFLLAIAQDEEHLEMLRALEIHSLIIVPLVARRKTLGALLLGFGEARVDVGPEEVELAEELAARAALAIDNARLYQESQVANHAKADFLAVISHELRTPLTAIIGYAELLSLGVPEPIPERQRDQVARIEVAARHLQQLIDEILTVVSLESGRDRVRRSSVEVRTVLESAATIIEPLARQKELALTTVVPDGDLRLSTDPDKLLQLLLNLLTNAVKFTERGEVHLEARRDGAVVEFLVRDTGVGLEPGVRERIFEPFWQVEQPITRRSGGTGLGLTLTRRLVRLLDGEIRVESTPGEGSLFAVRLPLEQPTDAPAPEPAPGDPR
jgi:signal transduction histidine kinase/PAS domain-containing protein